MALSKQEIEKIATLARIELSDEEKRKLIFELSEVLSYFEKLKEVDTSSIDMDLAETETTNTTRADESQDSGIQDKILDNAPAREDKFIKVRSVL